MNFPPVQFDLIPLTGGLDLVTPTLSLPPGVVRDARNFEINVTGGYTRIVGYERFSGKASPSAAEATGIVLNAAAANVVVGETITSGTGSAVVLLVDGANLIVTKRTGSFAVGATVLKGASTVGTTSQNFMVFTPEQHAIYANLAADNYRADIAAVPGSGDIRGIVYYKGTVYAWRDNAGGTALALYKSSGSGWTAVPLGYQLSFDTGSAEIVDGVTVTGASSGATGVVARVVLEDGAWGGSNATGRLILSATTGTFTAGENLTVSAAVKAKAVGAASAITLSPGGRVTTRIGNFGGQGGAAKVYGVDGVNKAFEFDGTTYVPLATGMGTDAPTRVAIHRNHLFLAFGASVQFSSINEPYRWSVILGAGEIALRDNVTDIVNVPGAESGDALAFYTANTIDVLYGSSAADWQMVSYSDTFGAAAYSAQRMEGAYAFDVRGVYNLKAGQNYGNFDPATLTFNIRPFLNSRRTLVTASGLNREKSQYRLFFSDGYGIYATIVNGKYAGSMPVVFPDVVKCWCEGSNADGTESSFFGSADGFVYQLDRGTSFDGDVIGSYIGLTYNSIKSPRVIKRFRKASVEVASSAYAQFMFGYTLGYGVPSILQPEPTEHELDLTAVIWDAFVWDTFNWDAVSLTPSEIEMTGSAENVSLRISCELDYVESFTVNSIITHYTMRRGMR